MRKPTPSEVASLVLCNGADVANVVVTQHDDETADATMVTLFGQVNGNGEDWQVSFVLTDDARAGLVAQLTNAAAHSGRLDAFMAGVDRWLHELAQGEGGGVTLA